jgi:uncharacterized protein (TIGR00730 family)
VFCASSDRLDGRYRQTARELGDLMAVRGVTLVYGGGNNGLMGCLSKAVHSRGGRIVGVIPRGLKEMGYAFSGADEMIVTDGMRERKAVMESRADGFIGLPGGFGTLEELLEIITLRQLGFHDKPIVILNTCGFFDRLLDQFETGYAERFIDPGCRRLYRVAGDAGEALSMLFESEKKP